MTITPQDRINGSSNKPTRKPVEIKPTSSAIAANEACPFIGLEDDPSTRLLFVSAAACCHRSEPVGAVDLSHQQEYCLAPIHKLCPVFMQPEWSPLPVELQYQEPQGPASKKRWLWLVFGLLAVGLVAGGLYIWGNGNSMTTIEPEVGVPAVVVASTDTPTPTPTVVESPTIVATKTAVASATPVPTNTNTPQPTVTIKPSATLVPTYTPVLPTETAVPLVQAVIAVPSLNIRSGPGTDYELLTTIAEGAQVELTGRLSDSSWWRICCVNGQPGWVIGEAIEIPADAEATVPRVTEIPSPPSPTVEP